MEAQRRIPKIREASGFNAVISENWGPLDRTPTLTPGADEAARLHASLFEKILARNAKAGLAVRHG